MLWISGVWDPAAKQRMIGYFGLLTLLLLAYAGATASGYHLFRLLL